MAFLQGTVLPMVFLEGFLFVHLIAGRDREELFEWKNLLVVFSLGALMDLIQGARILGVTSLIFLIFALVFGFVRESTISNKSLLFGVTVFLIDMVRSRLLFGSFFIGSSVIAAILAYFYFVLIFRPRYVGIKVGR